MHSNNQGNNRGRKIYGVSHKSSAHFKPVESITFIAD